jgi:hypothetical protein
MLQMEIDIGTQNPTIATPFIGEMLMSLDAELHECIRVVG